MKVPIAGRRVAKAEPRQIDKGVVSAVALLILAVVAITLTASGKVIEEPAKEAVGVLVDHAVHGCPYLPPETQAELVTIAAPVEDLGSGGDITYGAPGENSSSAKRRRLERGELLELPPVPEGKSALAIEANGPIASADLPSGTGSSSSSSPRSG